MPSNFHEQREQFQRNLITFLNTEVDLGVTFCSTAQLEKEMGNREHCARSTENARKALDTVRKLEGGITDTESWRTLHARADDLETLISLSDHCTDNA